MTQTKLIACFIILAGLMGLYFTNDANDNWKIERSVKEREQEIKNESARESNTLYYIAQKYNNDLVSANDKLSNNHKPSITEKNPWDGLMKVDFVRYSSEERIFSITETNVPNKVCPMLIEGLIATNLAIGIGNEVVENVFPISKSDIEKICENKRNTLIFTFSSNIIVEHNNEFIKEAQKKNKERDIRLGYD